MNHDRRVKRVGDGWGFVARIPATRAGRQYRRQGFATAKEANAALAEILSAAADGKPVSNRGSDTVEGFLRGRWLPSLPGRVRKTTEYSYTRIVDNHLIPHLGGYRIASLSPAEVEVMLAALAGRGLSAKTRANVRGCLSSALRDARRWKLTAANPVPDVANPRSDDRPVKVWTVEQLQRFLDRTDTLRLGAAWRVVALTGCRRGELLGTDWDRVDLDRGSMTINWQRTTAGGQIVEGPTKTKSGGRTVALDAGTVLMLRGWKRTQAAELLRLGVRPSPLRVVTNQSGRPHDPDDFTKQFRDVCLELGLEPIGVHGLRHSAASYWMSTGTNPRAVQQRLGHSDVGTTLRIYSHVLPGDDKRAADAFAAALAPKPSRKRRPV